MPVYLYMYTDRVQYPWQQHNPNLLFPLDLTRPHRGVPIPNQQGHLSHVPKLPHQHRATPIPSQDQNPFLRYALAQAVTVDMKEATLYNTARLIGLKVSIACVWTFSSGMYYWDR